MDEGVLSREIKLSDANLSEINYWILRYLTTDLYNQFTQSLSTRMIESSIQLCASLLTLYVHII